MTYDPRDLPLFTSVFHPTDFSESSEAAFAHALAIALIGESHLTLLHAGTRDGAWHDFPAVRGTLTRWGLLEPGDSREAVRDKLAVAVKKVITEEDDPMAAIVGYLDEHPTDLIVLATRGVKGVARWLSPSMAESLTRLAKLPTLLVPQRAPGFVSGEDGSVTLRRLLVPVDHTPDASPAVILAERAGHVLGAAEATLLHVGEGAPPEVRLPDEPRCRWEAIQREGPVVETILDTAREIEADLIVMVTDGRDGFLDVLRGTHTDRVLRHTPAPIMSLPEGWGSRPGEAAGVSIADLAQGARERKGRAATAMFRKVARAAHPDAGGVEDGELLDRAIRARDRGDVGELKSLADRADAGDERA